MTRDLSRVQATADCPTCGALAGHPCTGLGPVHRSAVQPHRSRVRAYREGRALSERQRMAKDYQLSAVRTRKIPKALIRQVQHCASPECARLILGVSSR